MATERGSAARWDLNVAISLFAILILIIILSSQGVGITVVGFVAVAGLGSVWFMGWIKERRRYLRFYGEELEQELRRAVKGTVEETIEHQVQRALRERWR